MSDSGDTPPAAQPPADHHPPPDGPYEPNEQNEPDTEGLPDDTGVGGTGAGTLLDTLRVAVVMLDTSGRVLLWSPLAEEVLGWAGEHIVGRRVGGLFAPGEQRSARAAAGDRLAGHGRAACSGELLRSGRWDGILSLRHRDGHTVQVEARASLLVDGDGAAVRPGVHGGDQPAADAGARPRRARLAVRRLAAGRGDLRQASCATSASTRPWPG